MATIKKYGKLWRVQMPQARHPAEIQGNRADAEAWARQIETEIDRGVYVSRTQAERTTVAALLDRYEQAVTPTKRCARAERYCLSVLRAEFGSMLVAQLRSQHVATYRDKRLAQGLAGGTVVKGLNTLAHVIETARREWGISLRKTR